MQPAASLLDKLRNDPMKVSSDSRNEYDQVHFTVAFVRADEQRKYLFFKVTGGQSLFVTFMTRGNCKSPSTLNEYEVTAP